MDLNYLCGDLIFLTSDANGLNYLSGDLIFLMSDANGDANGRLPAAKDNNVFSRGGQSQKTETKKLNRDYGNKNKV